MSDESFSRFLNFRGRRNKNLIPDIDLIPLTYHCIVNLSIGKVWEEFVSTEFSFYYGFQAIAPRCHPIRIVVHVIPVDPIH